MERYTVREWHPTGRTITTMNLAGIATLVVGLVVYASIWAAATGASGGGITGLGLLLVIVITFALMAIHEAIHSIVFIRLGGTPQYGATMVGKVLPAFYCTSPGSLFTRRQFLLIGLAPALVLVPATALGVALLPHGGWLVLPAAMHLGGCIGDFTMAYVVARLAPGTRVEDLKLGMRFYLPAGAVVAPAT